jgi:hypothetical protein
MRLSSLPFFSSKVSRFTVPMFTIFLATGASAFAQEPPSAPALPPADVQATMEKIGDLDLLKAILPLKLTEEQRSKLHDTLKEIVTVGKEKRKEDYVAIRALAEEVDKARTAALENGTPISTELEAKIIKSFGDSQKRFDAHKRESLQKVFALLKPLLSAEQMDTIDKYTEKTLGGKRVPREYANNPSSAPKDKVQDIALATYIERILLLDQTVGILARLKPQGAPAGEKDPNAAPPPPAGP